MAEDTKNSQYLTRPQTTAESYLQIDTVTAIRNLQALLNDIKLQAQKLSDKRFSEFVASLDTQVKLLISIVIEVDQVLFSSHAKFSPILFSMQRDYERTLVRAMLTINQYISGFRDAIRNDVVRLANEYMKTRNPETLAKLKDIIIMWNEVVKIALLVLEVVSYHKIAHINENLPKPLQPAMYQELVSGWAPVEKRIIQNSE